MSGETESRQTFVEQSGLILEDIGLPRMAGRALAWLLICEPAHQSARDLASALQASTGSISSTTRLLVQYGLVERLSLPGDRRDYFRIKPGGWVEILRQRVLVAHRFRELVNRGRALVEPGSPQEERLAELSTLYALFEDLAGDLLARWDGQRATAQP